ncbi:MAG: ABC transporter permease [Clostridiaceae bacterium]|nr:ABC transporter permease [Clostridiaceae bacterium]
MDFIRFVAENRSDLYSALTQHIFITITAVLSGAVLAIPFGIFLTRRPAIANPVMAAVGVSQTIPSLVMFGIAMPILGIGVKTALVVLVIYSIFPILRNTFTGISGVDEKYKEAAKGMGMNGRQVLFNVEIPLAMPLIITGIRISTVYIISWATLAALIGGGGLGDLIFTGLQTYNYNMILLGALPACILAVAANGIIGLLQKAAVPKGLDK